MRKKIQHWQKIYRVEVVNGEHTLVLKTPQEIQNDLEAEESIHPPLQDKQLAPGQQLKLGYGLTHKYAEDQWLPKAQQDPNTSSPSAPSEKAVLSIDEALDRFIRRDEHLLEEECVDDILKRFTMQ